MPANALTSKTYNGINVVSLWVSAEVRGYTTPVWATYKQWAQLSAQVRKGEKSSLVVNRRRIIDHIGMVVRPQVVEFIGSAR